MVIIHNSIKHILQLAEIDIWISLNLFTSQELRVRMSSVPGSLSWSYCPAICLLDSMTNNVVLSIKK